MFQVYEQRLSTPLLTLTLGSLVMIGTLTSCGLTDRKKLRDDVPPCGGQACTPVYPLGQGALGISAESDMGTLYLQGVNSEFSSSKLMGIDLATFDTKAIVSGESGSVLVHAHQGDLFLFNRSVTNQNVRRLSEFSDASAKIGNQTHLSGLQTGDPTEALSLDANRIFMSLHNQGGFGVWTVASDSVQTIKGAFSKLGKPTTALKTRLSGKNLILASSQSYRLVANGIVSSGPGQVFVFHDNGLEVVALDLNAVEDGIQGITLKGSFPDLIEMSDGSILSVSLCSSFVKNCDQTWSGVERINLETLMASEVWDLSHSHLLMNGPIIEGRHAHELFASVERAIPEQQNDKVVVSLDIGQRQWQEIYKFMPPSGGFYGLYHLKAKGELWVTDNNPKAGISNLMRLNTTDFAQQGSISLDATPIGPAFVSFK